MAGRGGRTREGRSEGTGAPLRVSVLIPVYNERATIQEVIERVLAQPSVSQVIVVDDCSADGTRELLRETQWLSEVKICYHERNMGKGAALRTGIPWQPVM